MDGRVNVDGFQVSERKMRRVILGYHFPSGTFYTYLG